MQTLMQEKADKTGFSPRILPKTQRNGRQPLTNDTSTHGRRPPNVHGSFIFAFLKTENKPQKQGAF